MRDRLIAEMREAGLSVANLVVDGSIQRVPSQGKRDNGWYVATQHEDRLYATYGDWATGETVKFIR